MMKNIFRLILTSVLISLSCSARAEIISTHDISNIKREIVKLSPGDMVLWDVKDVIFNSEDQVMTAMHKSYFKEKFKEIEKTLGKEKAAHLKSIVLDSYQPVLVDKEVPRIIEQAQKNKIIVLALTSGKTSAYETIDNRADKRIDTLQSFGIDFSKSIKLPDMDLGKSGNDQQDAENGNSVFQNGVIFASRIEKGDILGRFLKFSGLMPKKIIFIDNQLKNINFVGDKCAELGIEYVGIFFTKISKKPYQHLDRRIAEKKFEILLEKSVWISDNDAKALLEK